MACKQLWPFSVIECPAAIPFGRQSRLFLVTQALSSTNDHSQFLCIVHATLAVHKGLAVWMQLAQYLSLDRRRSILVFMRARCLPSDRPGRVLRHFVAKALIARCELLLVCACWLFVSLPIL